MNATRSSGSAATLALLAALGLLGAHVAAKATRDALFLSHFPVTDLPRVVIAAALASLLVAPIMSRQLRRRAPARVVPAALALSSALFAGEWLLLQRDPALASVILYLHFAGLGGVLISGFWSVVNERFDPFTGKSVLARIGAAAALGGVVGGLGAERISAFVGVPAMLLVLGGLHLGTALAVRAIGGSATAHPPGDSDETSGVSALRILAGTPLLVRMAALVALVAVVEQFLDYALKAEATQRYRSSESLIQFFAYFYTAAGLLAFALQASLGERVLRRVGLGGAMALAPGAVLISGTVAAALPRLLTVVIARGAAFALSTSFFRAGFELLYTPLPPAVKRPTKAYVDVGAQRLGDIAGGGLILALLFVLPSAPTPVVVVIALGGVVAVLLLITQLHQGYVHQLAHNLRSGTITLAADEAVDATTARTLAETAVAIDREELLARIREMQRTRAQEREGSADAREPAPAAGGAGPAADAPAHGVAARVAALGSSDPRQVRDALDAGRGDVRLLAHVIPLLERFDIQREVLGWVRDVAPRTIGQLTDVLLDPAEPALVRRRVPRALEVVGERRALEALLLGLADPDFDLRLQCSRSAARLLDRQPDLRPTPEVVYAIALRELGVETRRWEQQGRRREGADQPVLLDPAITAGVSRSLEHVFTVLALAFGSDLMGSALRGLFAADANLRGTALEYLEAALPDSLRQLLRPHLPGAGGRSRPRRASSEVAEELLRTSVALRRPGEGH
jgi:AAA family ATP:ADP antiporter